VIRGAGERPRLDAMAAVRTLILAAAPAGALVSALVGVTSLVAGGALAATAWPTAAAVWWTGDVLGALLVAPLFIAWFTEPAPTRNVRGTLEVALLCLGTALAAELGLGHLLPVPTLLRQLDYLYLLFGEWRRMQAMVARVPSLDTPAGEDWSDINIEFSSGVLAHVHIDYLQRPAVHRLTVVGDIGRAVCDYGAGELHWCPVDGEPIIRRTGLRFERNTMFLDAMQHFLDCVRDRTEPLVPLADGAAVLRMALQARHAAVSEPVHA